jgi:hypothetical protein
MLRYTTITVTQNIPLRSGERLTVKEPNGARTVYTVCALALAQRDDCTTTWIADVERHEPLWMTKERIRREMVAESVGVGAVGGKVAA